MARHRTLSAATGLAAVALAAGTALAVLPGAAVAGEFGQHVRQCAQDHGFSGTHNPGLHHGAAGWHDHGDC